MGKKKERAKKVQHRVYTRLPKNLVPITLHGSEYYFAKVNGELGVLLSSQVRFLNGFTYHRARIFRNNEPPWTIFIVPKRLPTKHVKSLRKQLPVVFANKVKVCLDDPRRSKVVYPTDAMLKKLKAEEIVEETPTRWSSLLVRKPK